MFFVLSRIKRFCRKILFFYKKKWNIGEILTFKELTFYFFIFMEGRSNYVDKFREELVLNYFKQIARYKSFYGRKVLKHKDKINNRTLRIYYYDWNWRNGT